MIKSFNNKKIILFGGFILVFMLTFYFSYIPKSLKEVSLNDDEIIEYNSDEEVDLGDENCVRYAQKCSYTCSGYQYKGSRPSNCRSGVPSNGGCAGSSFYVSCSNTGGVYCYRTSQRNTCVQCRDNYELKNGSCVEKIPKVASVSGGGKTVYLAAGESASFSFTAKSDPSNASNFSPSWSVSPGAGASGGGSGTTYSLRASGNGKGSGSSCKTTTYTVTAKSGGSSKSASASVCVYCSPWTFHSAKLYYKSKQNTSKPAKGCHYFVGEQQISGGYSYTGYWSRCCGSPPSSTLGACYGDEKYLGIASKVEWLPGPSGNLKYKYSNITDSNKCTLMPEPTTCTPHSLAPTPVNKSANYCEDEVVLDLKDGESCGGNEFYQVSCTKRIIVNFDYGNDGVTTSKGILAGLSYDFGIKISTIKTCEATFNVEAWKSTYKKIMDKINTIPASEKDAHVLSKKYELENKRKDIIQIVNSYNNYNLTDSGNEKAALSMDYTVVGTQKKSTHQFVTEVINEGSGKYSNVVNHNLGVSGVQNPRNYSWTNANDKRVVKLIPQKTYLNKYDGTPTTDLNKAVDGGNRIYVDYNIDTGKYKLKINVTGLGHKDKGSTVINNKCEIIVSRPTLYYRPIDVSNPFINSSREVGKNWLNNKYSFTNTIKANTWSVKSLNDLSISSSDIAKLKESNTNNVDSYPYLGLCERIETYNQDPITKKICGMINNTVD